MGAAGSVAVEISSEAQGKHNENLELQAAANWHRILLHANKGGVAAEPNENSHRADAGERKFDGKYYTQQSIFKVYLPDVLDVKGSTGYQLYESIGTNIFKTNGEGMVGNMDAIPEEAVEIFEKYELSELLLKLTKRSGNTLILEWDGAAGNEEVKDAHNKIEYELLVKTWYGSSQWYLIYSGTCRSIAVHCPNCNTKYSFRGRRLLRETTTWSRPSVILRRGAWGSATTIRTGPGAPSPVMGVSMLMVGCSDIKFTWQPPRYDNGLPILSYIFQIYMDTDGPRPDDISFECKNPAMSNLLKGTAPMKELKIDVDSARFNRPMHLCAPEIPFRPDVSYYLSVTAVNLAGQSSCDDSSSWAHFTTRSINDLSLTPWVLEINPEKHMGYYRHIETGSVSDILPDGALLDQEQCFINKLKYFKDCVSRRRLELDDSELKESDDQSMSPLVVSRDNILMDSLNLLGYSDTTELEKYPVRIQYAGEQGIDYGGIAKDWFSAVGRAMLDPRYSVLTSFEGAADLDYQVDFSQLSIKDNNRLLGSMIYGEPTALAPLAGLNVRYISGQSPTSFEGDVDIYRSIGLFFGKALLDERPVGLNIDPLLLKWLLFNEDRDVDVQINNHSNIGPTMSDLAASDFRLYSGLKWVLNDPHIEEAGLSFCATREIALSELAVESIDLIPDGSSINVNMENKSDYVSLMFQWFVKGRFEPALTSLLGGFRSLIPPNYLRFFTMKELQAILCGKIVIDVSQLRRSAVYSGIDFSSDHVVAIWFWEIISSMDQNSLSRFLLYCTGSLYLPVYGLSPPLNICVHDYTQLGKIDNDERLPEAHTCFNQIIFPRYSSKINMEGKLIYAIENSGQVFSLL